MNIFISERPRPSKSSNAGAELFVMPERHCVEAAGHIPKGLTVVPVATLDDTVDAIRSWVAGEPTVSCPAQD